MTDDLVAGSPEWLSGTKNTNDDDRIRTERFMSQQELDFDDVRTNFANCPEPGVHRDVDFEAYRSWTAVNSGVVTWGTVSMRHFQAALNGELSNDDSKSRKFGRAVHTRLLEPEVYKQRVLVSQPCCAVLKSGDRKGVVCGKSSSCIDENMQWFCGTHKPTDSSVPTDYVSADEADRIEQLATELHSHKAMSLLKADGWSEVSLVFDINGVRMKGRIDRFSQPAKFILDLKKCRVGYGTMEECRKAIGNYGYMRQMALYRKGVETLLGFTPRCVWLFVEEGSPYQPQIVEAADWELDHAWSSVSGIVNAYVAAKERGVFDGYIKFDNDGKIISSHMGGYPDFMARAIEGGRA